MSLLANVSPVLPADLEPLRRVGTVIGFPRGASLCRQGELAESIYLIEEGLVIQSIAEPDGRQYCLAYRLSGWIIGADELLLGQPSFTTVIAREATKVRVISGSSFLRELKSNESLSQYVHRMHAMEIHEQREKAAGLALLSVRQRLEEFLWDLFKNSRSESNGRVAFSAGELAQFVGATPQHLSTVLGELEAAGNVKRSKGWLVVEDRERLWRRGK